MLLKALPIAINNAIRIFQQIKAKHPAIHAYLVLASKQSQTSINTEIRTMLDVCDDFFVASDALMDAWALLDEIWDLNEIIINYRRIKMEYTHLEEKIPVLTAQYEDLVHLIEIDGDEVCVELRWDEIDFEINKILRQDTELVDVTRTPQLGGIRICLGTVAALVNK